MASIEIMQVQIYLYAAFIYIETKQPPWAQLLIIFFIFFFLLYSLFIRIVYIENKIEKRNVYSALAKKLLYICIFISLYFETLKRGGKGRQGQRKVQFETAITILLVFILFSYFNQETSIISCFFYSLFFVHHFSFFKLFKFS